MLILNFGLSSIIVLLVDASLLNESLKDLLAGGETNCLLILPAVAIHLLLHLLLILELNVLLLHEILQVVNDYLIGSLVLTLHCSLQ